jgi:iron complex outermembrane receptor protein
VDGTYVSSIALFPDNAAATEVKGNGRVNARLAYQAPSKIWEAALWVKNLNSARVISSIAPVITQDQINYNDPRTFGVQLVAHF